jgi:hypothetical protein
METAKIVSKLWLVQCKEKELVDAATFPLLFSTLAYPNP